MARCRGNRQANSICRRKEPMVSPTDARNLADDVLRCPNCGKGIESIRCPHCGRRISLIQRALIHSVNRQLVRTGGAPHEQGDSDFDPSVIPDSSGSDSSTSPPVNHERYTCPELVALVHQTLGQIDLDPASSKEANKVVKAKSFFTKQKDGLRQQWRGRVFLNPPFDNWPTWVAKLDSEIAAGRVKKAIIIGPSNMSAFRPLLKRGGLLFLPDDRPKYHDPNSDRLIDPPFGSLICYVGQGHVCFSKVFGASGLVLQPVKASSCR